MQPFIPLLFSAAWRSEVYARFPDHFDILGETFVLNKQDSGLSRRVFLGGSIAALGLAGAGVRAADETCFVYISGYNNLVTCFEFNPMTGEMKQLSQSDCGKNPTYLSIHPSRKFIYAANEIAPGKITSYSIDPKDGKLTLLNEASAGGGGPCHILVHPDGKWVFTGNYGSGHIGVAPINLDGTVGTPLEPVLGGKNAHQISIDPSGKFVFVPFLGSNHVNQYLFDEATGKLTPNDPPFATASVDQAGPRHIAFHPSGRFAYVINEKNCTIDSFEYDRTKGLLSNPKSLPTMPADAYASMKGKSTAHVVVSPDGKFVYGSNRGHDSIAIYSVDSATGRLTFVAHENGGGEVKTPRDFALDPSGKFAIVANQAKDYILVFKRDEAKGTLEKIASVKVPEKGAYVGFMAKP